MKTFEQSLKNVRDLSSPALDDALRFGIRMSYFAEAYKRITQCNNIFLECTQKARSISQYKHWIAEVVKHNVYDRFACDVFNDTRSPLVDVSVKKKSVGFGHCLICVEFYWNIVNGARTFAYYKKKEFEYASCGRDLRSIAEMVNAFHHERLSKACEWLYG